MRRILLLIALLLPVALVYGQKTTSSISGSVFDANGEPLVGANVVAIHVPSGTQYGVSVQDEGRFNIRNMRIGGPYEVHVSFLGYTENVTDNIFLELGGRFQHNVVLYDEGVNLDEIVVLGQESDVLNNQRTGASTNVSNATISKLPSITRSTADYTRLNPAASAGGSFGGRNDQFNNYSLDGAVFNNPFGLDAATPGGQANAQPIPLDALDQISVDIAPFDVTQSGFTGAGINLATKSGTNEFHGSAYAYYRNDGLTGDKVLNTEIINGDLYQFQAGASIGGPIVKNKVFFFANVEVDDRSEPMTSVVADRGQSGDNVSRVLASDLDMISNILRENYGYETGAYENFDRTTENIKGIFKFDFNISDNHKLTAKYNFLDASRDNTAHPSALGRRGPDLITLQYNNSGYRINNKLHSGSVELKSFFGSKFSNKFQAIYTAFRDNRDPFSTPFPAVNITQGGVAYIIAGHEPFSINNVLDQDVYQIRNDFNIYSGNHTWTIGASFERFEFDNSFNLGVYGGVFGPGSTISFDNAPAYLVSNAFDSIVDAARNTFNTNNSNDSWALAETNVGQFSPYIQDEINVTNKLVMTIGLRLDFPLYFNTSDLIQENIDRKGGTIDEGGTYAPDVVYFDEDGNSVQFDHTKLPSTSPLVNPRVGFNYDVNGDRSFQLRGGTGLFSGRLPFVWIGNQVANPDFFFYSITDPDFKFPQVWKTNLGIDNEWKGGWVSSVDLIYTKDLQAQMTRNFGLNLPTGTLAGPGARPIYRVEDRAMGPFGGPTNAYVFTSEAEGYQFNASFELQRVWGNNFFKIGYNYLKSEDIASIDSEISGDAYDRNPASIQHSNNAELANSLYGNRHRILGAGSRRFEYGAKKEWATTVSLFFEYAEGTRYSYVYSGDINNDGSRLNDLIYVPTRAEIDAMQFDPTDATPEAQRAALNAFIEQDEYLSDNRGQFTEKNGALAPWFNTWDFRIAQDYLLGNDQGLQFSIDVLNLGNLLNSDWGVREIATTTTGLAQFIGANTDAATGSVVYSFDPSLTETYQPDLSLNSRWRIQLGLRYTF